MARGSVQVKGGAAKEFAALARDLRRAGSVTLRRELYAAVQRAGRDVIEAARTSARQNLPQTGGLAERVANSAIRIRPWGNQSGRTASFRITATERNGSAIDLRQLDEGRVRHPPWGHKHARWSTQRVQVGWFSRPAASEAVANLDREVRAVVKKINDEISNGGR